jgi:hypothetical protein
MQDGRNKKLADGNRARGAGKYKRSNKENISLTDFLQVF